MAILIIFILTYLGMIIFTNYRAHIAVTSALITIIFNLVPLNYAIGSINYNVLMMIAGTMGTVALFIESKMPALLADIIIDKAKTMKLMILTLSIFAGIISAFVDNVATVLMVAPIAITISKKINQSPVPAVIAISIASNLQGAATLVGDTTSILLAGYNQMNFLDFFIYNGKIGLFWIVQISMIFSTIFLYFNLKKYNQKITLDEHTKVTDYLPTILLLATIFSLIIFSFIDSKHYNFIPFADININGYICMLYCIIGFLIQGFRHGFAKIFKTVVHEGLDFYTLFLLAGLFVVIGAVSYSGLIDQIANMFVNLGTNNIFVLYTAITFISVLLSAFIDNIPYVATMLPVIGAICTKLGIDPTLLYFGLLSGATLGGNITPIGASANITSLGMLKKAGYQVESSTFMKMSVPYTLIAVLSGYVLIWLIY